MRRIEFSLSSFPFFFGRRSLHVPQLAHDHMSCQQFMHLPEWLDIEVRKERKIQVGPEYSCCAQCRWGGHHMARRLRSLISNPVYYFFYIFVLSGVVITVFIDQTDTGRQMDMSGNSPRKTLDTVLLVLMMLDSVFKLAAVGWEPFIFDFWLLFEGFTSVSALVFHMIINSVDQVDESSGQIVLHPLHEYGRVLQFVRVLPLLKILNANPRMRIVLRSIYQSLFYILHLFVVILAIWYIWADVGVQAFGGILRQVSVRHRVSFAYNRACALLRTDELILPNSHPLITHFNTFDGVFVCSFTQTAVMDGNTTYGTMGYTRSATLKAITTNLTESEYNLVLDPNKDIVYPVELDLGLDSAEDANETFTAANVTIATVQVFVDSYERYINFDSLASTMFITMLHLTLLNNWHVTYEALLVGFENAHSQYISNTRNVGRLLVM